MEKHELPGLIAWDLVMAQPRCAGGHEDIMSNIFGPNAEVVAKWIEDGWSGAEAFAYRFRDGSVAIITDYFGSCSGCDSWGDASDVSARSMVASMVNSARLLPDATSAAAWCRTESGHAENYPHASASNLADALAAIGDA